MKPFTTLAAVLLSLVALAPLLRLLLHLPVTIGTTSIPQWVSIGGAIIPAALAVGLWRERTHRSGPATSPTLPRSPLRPSPASSPSPEARLRQGFIVLSSAGG